MAKAEGFGYISNQFIKESCMKSTILNIITIAALSLSGMALAVDEVEPKAMPVEESAAQAVVPAEPTAQSSAAESVPVAKSTHRDKPTKRNRSRTLDLRYCLEQESNVAIATCSGEQ
jgi:hypothetical protein